MLVELKVVEQRYRAVIDVFDGMSVTDVARRNGVTRQSDIDRKGGPPDGAHLAPTLRERWDGGAGRQELEARELSSSDEFGDRGSSRRVAPDAPGLGAEEHPHSTLKGWVLPSAGPLIDLSHLGAPSPGRADQTQAGPL